MTETWEPRPLPKLTPETAPFFAAAADGRLALGECPDCGLTFYYPRGTCPDCLSPDVSLVDAAGTGEIYSYTVLTGLENWPEDALPVVLAYVELDEDVRLMTNVVDCDPEALSIGDDVRVAFVDTEREDVAIPVFEPA